MNIERKLNNISCVDYCNIHNFKYSIQQKEYSQKVYIPYYRENPEADKCMYANFPETYIAELYNVNLLGGNSIIFDENNNCIYDLPLMDDENRFELAYGNAIFVDKNFTSIYYSDLIETIEQGIMLISNASFNYFHYNLESLSKLCLINEIDEYNKLPILVDERCATIQSLIDELKMLNLQGREIIYLKQGYCYKVKKLIYISELLIEPINLKRDALLRYDDYIFNEVAVKRLHNNLSIDSKIFRKLYISRKNGTIVRLLNQDKIEQIFEEYGYEIIYPEKMSFQEQLKIFSEAEIIAGASGAGLTNMLFANSNAKLICILPKEIKFSCYSSIAGILGQKYYFLDANIHYNSYMPYYQCNVELGEEYLRKFLKDF